MLASFLGQVSFVHFFDLASLLVKSFLDGVSDLVFGLNQHQFSFFVFLEYSFYVIKVASFGFIKSLLPISLELAVTST